MNDKKRKLIVAANGGLCNRIIVLLSGYVLAQAANRDFQMIWEPNYLCNCEFGDLFENDFNIITDASSLNIKPVIYGPYDFKYYPVFDILESKEDLLFVKSHWWLIDPGKYPVHDTLKKRINGLFRELEPVAYVRERVGRLKKSFVRPMLGVHIRRTDFYRCYPETQVSLGYFMKYIDRFIRKFPSGKVFISTDEDSPDTNFFNSPFERIEERARDRYADKVIFSSPRIRQRNSPEAIQDALVDLLLLRETDYFVGTRHSSFSHMAIFDRKIKSVMVPRVHFIKKIRSILNTWIK